MQSVNALESGYFSSVGWYEEKKKYWDNGLYIGFHDTKLNIEHNVLLLCV